MMKYGPQVIDYTGKDTGSAIFPNSEIKMKISDIMSEKGENPTDVYYFAYKWVKQPEESYTTNIKEKIFHAEDITIPGPSETGDWYLQFYMSDGSDNKPGWWIRYRVRDDIEGPKDFKVDGPEIQYVDLNDENSNYVIPTVTAFDESDNKEITAVPNQAEINALAKAKEEKKVGEYKITYTAIDSDDNESTYQITIHLVDKSNLNEIIDEAEKLDENEYKGDTWDKVQEKLDEIKENKDKYTQEEINKKQEELQEAIDGLVKKDEPILNVQKIQLSSTYEDNLSSIDLTKIALPTNSNGDTINGTYAWVLESEQKPEDIKVGNAGINNSYTLKFTPEDTRNYKETIIPAEITVNPKVLTIDEVKDLLDIEMPQIPEGGFVYDANKTVEAINKTNVEGLGTIQVKYFDEEGNEVQAPKNAGTYTVKVEIKDSNNYVFDENGATTIIVENIGTIKIAKADQVAPDPYLNPEGNVVITGAVPEIKTRNEMLEKDTNKITYSSSNPEVATIDVSTGKLTILKVGNTTITVTYGETKNYKKKSGETTLNVVLDETLDASAFSIEADKNTFTYGDTDIKATVTQNNTVAGKIGDITIVKYLDKDGNEVTPTNAGEYTVVIDVANGTHYAGKQGLVITNGKLVIDGATYNFDTSNLKFDSTQYRYNGQNHAPKLTIETFNDENVSAKYIYKDASGKEVKETELKGIGKYTVEVAFELTNKGKENYKTINPSAPVSIEFEILTRPVNVTIDHLTSIYGETIKPLTYVTEENNGNGRGLIAGDNLGITLSKAEGKDVKIYNITGTATNKNYEVYFINGENAYEITPKDITVTANSITKEYGSDVVTNIGFTAEGLVNGDTLDKLTGITVTANDVTKTSNAGEYTITLNVDEANKNANYNITAVNGKYTITKKVLTETELKALLNINIPEGPFVYDPESKGIVATNNTNVEGLGTITIKHIDTEGSEVTPKDAGNYKVKVDITGATNYAFVQETNTSINDVEVGSIVISKAEQADPMPRLVPSNQVTITNTAPTIELVNQVKEQGSVTYTSSDSKVATVDVSTGAIALVGKGTTEITVTYGATKNYSEKSNKVTLIVGLDTLEASDFEALTQNNTFTYGDTEIKATVTPSSEIQGKIGSITIKYYQNGEEIKNPTNKGEYDIVISVQEGTHYAATTEDLTVGKLIINPKEIDTNSITFSGTNKDENGKVTYNKDVKQTITPDNLIENVVISGYEYKEGSTVTPDGIINAGTHTVTVKFAPKSDNYIVNPEARNVQFTISKADVDMTGVVFADQTFGYDQDFHSIFLDETTLPEEVRLSGYEGNNQKEIGIHSVKANFEIKDAYKNNYNVPNSITAKMTIEQGVYNLPASIRVDKNTLTYTYDGTYHIPSMLGVDDDENIKITGYIIKDSNLNTTNVNVNDANLGVKNAETYQVAVLFELTEKGKELYKTIAPSSYTINGFKINPRPITVVVTPTSNIYGEKEEYIDYTLKDETQIATGDNKNSLGIELKKADGTNAGKYNVTGTAKNKNYMVDIEGGENAYTIEPKVLTETELKAMLEVTPDGTNNNNIFNYKAGETHTGAVVIKNGIEGLGTVTVEHYNGETKVDAPENVGTYDIKVNVTGATNYAFGTDKNANISGVKVRRNKNKSNSI